LIRLSINSNTVLLPAGVHYAEAKVVS